jgi:hypothetical protein
MSKRALFGDALDAFPVHPSGKQRQGVEAEDKKERFCH